VLAATHADRTGDVALGGLLLRPGEGVVLALP
jgi:hypothetical protein